MNRCVLQVNTGMRNWYCHWPLLLVGHGVTATIWQCFAAWWVCDIIVSLLIASQHGVVWTAPKPDHATVHITSESQALTHLSAT
jgi:hypothetical protein